MHKRVDETSNPCFEIYKWLDSTLQQNKEYLQLTSKKTKQKQRIFTAKNQELLEIQAMNIIREG